VIRVRVGISRHLFRVDCFMHGNVNKEKETISCY
jgi:hypothetical protein